MARTELPHGVILPAEYSDDWYEDMTSNLTKLDDVIGSDSEKLNADGVYFLRMSSAALTDGGTGNFSDLNSSYKIKTGDLVLDSGRKLYQVVSADSTNETFTVGNSQFKITAESDLAPVAESGDYDDLDNKPDLKPVATSGDYDDLTELPTYGITRYCSSAITDNSSVAFSSISSTNKIKVGDFLLDTNGKLYQISAVDTANETVSVTTPLTQLAVNANVMHLSGNETASGFKTFDRYIQCNGGYIGTEFSTNTRTEFILRSNRDTSGQSGVCISKFRQNRPQGSMSGTDTVQVSFDVLENSVRTNRLWYLNWLDWENDIPKTVELRSFCQKVDYRLTHINGLNPGVLSLPDLNNGIDISGYLTAGNSNNTYTPPVNGWISISIGIASGGVAIFIEQGDMKASSYSNTSKHQDTGISCFACLPVVAGVVVNIGLKGSNNYINSAKFFPCKGNV